MLLKTFAAVGSLLLALSGFAQDRPYLHFESRDMPITDEIHDPLTEKDSWKDFNINGQVKTFTEAWTHFQGNGRPIQRLNPYYQEFEFVKSGRLIRKTVNDELGKKTETIIYDDKGRKKEVRRHFKDTLSFQTLYAYNESGKLAAFEAYGTDNSFNLMPIFKNTGTFDESGNLIKEVSIRREYKWKVVIIKTVLEHSYNQQNQRIRTERFRFLMDDDSTFVLLRGEKTVTFYKYDEQGRNIEIVDETTTDITPEYKAYSFDENGNLLEYASKYKEGMLQAKYVNEYDENQRLTKHEKLYYDSFGKLDTYRLEITTYDGFGNVMAEEYSNTPNPKVLQTGLKKAYKYANRQNWVELVTVNLDNDRMTHARKYIYY